MLTSFHLNNKQNENNVYKKEEQKKINSMFKRNGFDMRDIY